MAKKLRPCTYHGTLEIDARGVIYFHLGEGETEAMQAVGGQTLLRLQGVPTKRLHGDQMIDLRYQDPEE